MSSRRFCAKALLAGKMEEVVKATDSNTIATINFINQGQQPAKLSVAYVKSHNIEEARNSDWLLFNTVLNPGASKELKGIPVENGTMIAARFINVGEETTMSVVAYGFDAS